MGFEETKVDFSQGTVPVPNNKSLEISNSKPRSAKNPEGSSYASIPARYSYNKAVSNLKAIKHTKPFTESLATTLSNGTKVLGLSVQGFHTPDNNNDSIHVIQGPKYEICCVADGVTEDKRGSIKKYATKNVPKYAGKFWAENFAKDFAKNLSEAKDWTLDNKTERLPSIALKPKDLSNSHDLLIWLIENSEAIELTVNDYPENARGYSSYEESRDKSIRKFLFYLYGKERDLSKEHNFYQLIQTVFKTNIDLGKASFEDCLAFSKNFINSLPKDKKKLAEEDLQQSIKSKNKDLLLGNLAKFKAVEILKLVDPKIISRVKDSNIIKAVIHATNSTAKSFQKAYKNKEYIDPETFIGATTFTAYIRDKESNEQWILNIGDSGYHFTTNDYQKLAPRQNNDANFGAALLDNNLLTIYPKDASLIRIPQQYTQAGGLISLYSDGLRDRIKRQFPSSARFHLKSLKAKAEQEYKDKASERIIAEVEAEGYHNEDEKWTRVEEEEKKQEEIIKKAAKKYAKQQKAIAENDIISGTLAHRLKKANCKMQDLDQQDLLEIAKLSLGPQLDKSQIFKSGYSNFNANKESDDVSLMLIAIPGQIERSEQV